ncbi:AT-rich interactive domain-containing protein 5B isoform X1 [Equus przewalskii]|uniref:AT-rich interactive domain-containing protein 5B n=2 Tax=Equus przewalskii TaxID=9798 RepID=A0ABM2FDA8_EQUPR|nr:AT-rich interactive domain-containing protein 5B isoform X1 [Equus caballus]XP_008530802.1 PREDICTED: AT-rich interactive domain-containing protein 5B isoform X1 [Equus przewalskii]
MEPNSLQWVGSPCGLHGPYIFYKAFQFHLEGKPRILSLGDFFFVRCTPKDPICIAELQLLWEERTSRQLLSSSKLYFLPEDTPQGRNSDHGEDEVIAVSEKVIVKLEDLVKWVHSDFSKWRCGLQAGSVKTEALGRNGQKEALLKYRQSTLNSGLNFKDVLKEKADLGEDEEETNVIVLSYPQYCRYRSMLKRIQDKPSSILTDQFALALGGIAVVSKNPQILYCRDTFDHPTLIENESICDEFERHYMEAHINQHFTGDETEATKAYINQSHRATPNLKGRPRKKKPCPQRRDSFSGVKDSNNNSDGKAVAKVKCEARSALTKPKNNHNNCKKVSNEEKPKVAIGEECRADEQAFLVALYKYMKERKTPIERIPYLGFKQINLWTMFQAAQKLGGYETITARRQWKHIYDELGGNPGSTSAATCTRRHYERLILPYERFIKGEEDKPLPPIKPRKQENSSQENENKTKVSGTKRIKHEIPKSKKEKENAPKPQDASEVSSEQEKEQETLNQKSITEPLPVADMKKKMEGYQDFAARPLVSRADPEKDNETDQGANSEKVAEEAGEKGPAPPLSGAPPAPERDPAPIPGAGKQSLTSPSTLMDSKQESKPCCFTESPEDELQEVSFPGFPTTQPPLANQSEMEDDKLPAMADYIANCTVKVDQLGSDDIHNALKQTPKVLVVQSFDMFKDKDLTGPMNENHGLNYTPLLYSRGNPGIMSPLAKKKLLSQVSGASLSSSYPYGSPPPLISKKKLIARDDLCSGLSQAHHGQSTDHMAVSRPSVIQHVQSFRSKPSEERKSINDIFKHDKLSRSDPHRCSFSKHHLSPLADSYVLKQEIQEGKEKLLEKRALPHSHMPSFLADFYSSPHLHSLYRHTEHHLHNEQTSKYPCRDMYRESENISFPSHKHQEKVHVNYLASLHLPDKKSAAAEAPTDDQPTDLSLPKNPHKPTGKVLGLAHSAPGPQESKGISQFQVISSQSRDCHPKACRVSPMTMSAPKKYPESLSRSGKPHHVRLENFRKMEGMVHPILHRKMSPQNIGAARPIKRSLEDLDLVIAGKKARAVSPLDASKDVSGKEKASEQESEGSKAAHGGHSGGASEAHKLPLSSPIFPGLYSGSLCNSGLNSRLPAGYSHSLQYLKNQTVLSPLMQPLAFHSLVMQRGIFTSPTNSQQLYRHLAAATPVGSSYGDLLHNSIYPLAAINPQAAFPSSQLSSVHPSTKL